MDFGEYGEFLEQLIRDIIDTQPKNIGVCFFSDDGEPHTHYFGNCYPSEVGQMVWQLNADAFLTMAQANAGSILEAAEEEEDESEP